MALSPPGFFHETLELPPPGDLPTGKIKFLSDDVGGMGE